MNGRLAALAEQAGYFIRFERTSQGVTVVYTKEPGTDGDLALFAELIVGKCIAQCEQFLDDPDFTIGAMRCAIQLNQYFGVEE